MTAMHDSHLLTNETLNYQILDIEMLDNHTLINDSFYNNDDSFIKSETIYFICYLGFLQLIVYYFIYLADTVICKYYSDKARWFQIHSFGNLFVCLFSFLDIISITYDLNEVSLPLTQYIGGSFALQIHLYHTLNFKLTAMDKFHHISSVFLCFPPSIIFNKKVLSLFYFIGTGLPGGIDYLLLTLVKNGQLDYMKEKKYNSYINAYLRMPGGAVCSFLTFNSAINNDIMIEKVSGLFLSFIAYANTAFFGKLAIENYIERLQTEKIEK